MRNTRVFDTIEFEVEHPLYLARIQQVQTGETEKVRLNEFEVKRVPTFAVTVLYLPKFARATFNNQPLVDKPKKNQSYRVLYETRVVVGIGKSRAELMRLTELAQHLAYANPDPAYWKEVADSQT